MSESLSATIQGWQDLWDEGRWDDRRLAEAVMGLDVETEARAGEILELRRKLAVAIALLMMVRPVIANDELHDRIEAFVLSGGDTALDDQQGRDADS